MLYLGRAKFAFKVLKSSTPVTLYSSVIPFVPRRAFSLVVDSHKDLFEYTSGNWVYNDALRHKERSGVFDVIGLCRLAAESVNQNLVNVAGFSKLAEGGFNRTFLITLHDGFQLVARVPYPITVPKFHAVASEVATLEFLRSVGLPVPKVYGYSPDSDNAAGTEYIFMQLVRGSKLSDVWFSLDEHQVISVVRQLTQFESIMMSLSFPAGGSLYFTKDLDKVAPGLGIPLEDNRFCVGPDTRLPLWYGRRSKLGVNRGPYPSAEVTLLAGAQKELAYLERFGQQPLLPFRRERRAGYEYKEQSPLSHIENLNLYLLIASSLVPRDPNLNRFCIRHPDLQQNNIFVSRRTSDSGCQEAEVEVVSLLDWQHASILPMFLHAGVPQRLQNYADPVSQSMTLPSLPADFDKLDETERIRAEEVYRDRLVHYHYVTSTEKCNKPHYAALTDPMYALRGRLFHHASSRWEGETFELKLALIQATENWPELTGGVVPCPLEFDPEDVRETKKLNEVQAEVDMYFETLQNMAGVGEEGWVPSEDYEETLAFFGEKKEEALSTAQSEEERAEIMNHWPWDDIDEEKYM